MLKRFKTALLIMILLCFFVANNGNYVVFAVSTPQFAQIKNSSTYLYKSAELNESINNKWCLIENTYFVNILNNYNDVFYKAEYNNVVGYVKKDSINLINETPAHPYPANISFNINNAHSCYLRLAPKIKESTNNIIATIPAGSKLKFIGKIIGEEAIDFKGSIWYLTEYDGIKGYVYSGYTNNIGAIMINSEEVTNFNGYDFSKINPLTNPTCIFIICLMLLPALAILFLIYLPVRSVSKVNNKNAKHKKNSISYYDENL